MERDNCLKQLVLKFLAITNFTKIWNHVNAPLGFFLGFVGCTQMRAVNLKLP